MIAAAMDAAPGAPAPMFDPFAGGARQHGPRLAAGLAGFTQANRRDGPEGPFDRRSMM
ncbi:MAG: hypothetical protein R3322_12225 [Kiloniellales bacterium]|nr:hypothetical protein [Kiloniellales bacterium]